MNKVHYKHCNTATRPAGTGTLENVASEDQAKSTNLPKYSLTFATWNVRTLLTPESPLLLSNSLKHHQINIACLQETRPHGEGVLMAQETEAKNCYKKLLQKTAQENTELESPSLCPPSTHLWSGKHTAKDYATRDWTRTQHLFPSSVPIHRLKTARTQRKMHFTVY